MIDTANNIIPVELVDRIIKIAAPECIFLLGSKQQHCRIESIFNTPTSGTSVISEAWLCVVLKELGSKSRQEWQDTIEANCTNLIPIITTVVEAEAFSQWCYRFAGKPLQQEKCLYCSTESSTSITSYIEARDITALQSEFNAGFQKASEFLAGAELYRIRKQYNLSAFMLHQSAEQCLLVLILVATEYKANTHNVERLLRYSSFLAVGLSTLFLQHRKEDTRLIKLLQRAYIDTRYSRDYSIHFNDLIHLTDKVKTMISIVSKEAKRLLYHEYS